jgi:hypothetical protein
MKKDKKVMKYQAGDMVEAPQESMGAMMGALGAGAGAGAGATEAGIEGALADAKIEKIKPKKRKRAKKKKVVKKMGGGMLKYGHGGGVKGGKPRGCGMARQGVRNAKMVVMKGS